MRELIRWVLSLFLPPSGKRRSTEPAEPAPVARPVPPVRPARAERFAPLDGGAVALVRPYLVAWEREQERRRQRDRRRAAVLASLGQDYPGAAA
jgi:hypothetical protein